MMRILFLLIFLCQISHASGWITLPAYGDGHWKGPVATSGALPSSGNSVGDCRVAQSTSFIYCWTGSAWFLAAGGGTPPGSPNTSLQFNNSGGFGGIPNWLWDGNTLNATSNSIAMNPPATVTVTAFDVDPTIVGVCNDGFTNTPLANYQYWNDTTSCTANGLCYNGSTLVPGDTDQTTCTNDGFTWYFNTFTPTSPSSPYHPLPANDTVVSYIINSYNATYGFYSATGTTGTFTAEFDTSPSSINGVQNESETGCSATGVTYNFKVFSIESTGLRSQGSDFTFTDDGDTNSYALDMTWAQPLSGPPASYLILETNSNTALASGTTSVKFDCNWAGYSDPGLGSVGYHVTWSAASPTPSSYHITGPLGSSAFYTLGLSFNDYGNPYLNNSSVNPKGPNSVTALLVDGSTVLRNTVGSSAVSDTLDVYSPHNGGCGYSQRWFNGSTNALAAYIDCTGNMVGTFTPVSGNFSVGGTLSGGNVTFGTGFFNTNGNGTFQLTNNTGINNFFRVSNASASTQMEAQPAILFFDENVSTGTPGSGFGGGVVIRAQDSTTGQVQAGGLYAGWKTATHATYAGEMRQCLFDHNNTSTPICFMDATSNGSGVITSTFPNGPVSVTNLTASRAVATDASKNLVSATTTGTELNLLSGVTAQPRFTAASAYLTAQSAAGNVTTLTPGSDGTYRIGGNVTITAVSVDILTLQVTYTDETSGSRTQTFFPQGLTSANLATTGAFTFPPMDIRAKSGNAITVKTNQAVGGGSETFNVGASIEKLY